ncbi:MAG TPA: tRNA (guanine-N(1)-)-methyltransferase, partial [Erysipelotrichaceae bacterium]|nr:tRNA (guanine-N(1)-)-methyltransferase [Erysipelotrichaceae bacterium]
GLLEYPQYTRPADYEGRKVPDVLLSGDHEKIRIWRLKQSLKLTKERRPDLLENRILSEEEKDLLQEIEEETD